MLKQRLKKVNVIKRKCGEKMPGLTYKEKLAIQFIRNKSAGLQPTSQRAIA